VVERKRHLAKAFTYRCVGSVGTAVIAYIATGDARVGASIGALETIAKVVIYYLHERAWYRVKWGIRADGGAGIGAHERCHPRGERPSGGRGAPEPLGAAVRQ
jgi:uncharacterized membrane protein